MNRHIRSVSILGSGVMGASIAAHFANAGFPVLLLDLVAENSRNARADMALKGLLKSKPDPLFHPEVLKKIKTGNFEDDLPKIKNSDWILEVVVEDLSVKQSLFEKVDKYRKTGSIVSSNTSGIPIHQMLHNRSEDFKKHFIGTHFFNPPRYLQLLEIIPTAFTEDHLVRFLLDFGDRFLGKQTVLCKDTPGFIANRIGVYLLAKAMEITKKLGLSFSAVDKLTGPAIGRPKTGTYRLADLVGIDVIDKVINGLKTNASHDEMVADIQLPEFFKFLIKKEFYGDKTGQGFYRRTLEKDEHGRTVILELDGNSLEYGKKETVSLPSLNLSKQIEDVQKRIPALLKTDDEGGEFIRQNFASMFAYASHRIPEISDHLFQIDAALKAGFAWEFGPFEYWDLIGIKNGIELCEKYNSPPAEWVYDLAKTGKDQFYQIHLQQKQYYNIESKEYQAIPGSEGLVKLSLLQGTKLVYSNEEVALYDIGDGVLNLKFKSKMNAIGEGILRGIQDSIDIAEKNWKGLVIGNEASNFTVGANLMLIGMMAFQQQFDELNMAVALFQNTTMRCRYSAVPVVAATQGYVFGGGCETIMHCDAIIAAAESYIGLVEVGVGLIPGGGGTKEFALRASDSFFEGDVMIPTLLERFKTIATADVATSAYQGFTKGYLDPVKDRIIMRTSRNITEAKKEVLRLSDYYIQPARREDIKVLGRGGMASLFAAANSLKLGNYASDHDIVIAKKIAHVLCGGDLTGAQIVSEQYLLDLEREAFLSLAGEPKTLERIQHMLETGRALRN